MSFDDVYASALVGGIEQEVDALTAPEVRPPGDRAVYRAIFRGMEVHGLPAEVEVAGVLASFVLGPVLTQQTEVSQRAGIPLTFDKSMNHGVEIGAGQWLTVLQITLSPLPDNFADAMIASRERAQAVAAFLSSILDERIAQELLAEDLVFFDGSEPVAAADLRQQVRSYLPFEVRGTEADAIAALQQVDPPRHIGTAARWYLRGVQAGPGVDGVIFLWFAVEAIVGTSKKSQIEAALRDAGRDPADQEIGVGELHGIRSKFVHDKAGSKPPPQAKVRQAFYDLENMVKAMLRHALGAKSTWPTHSASRVFHPPWQERVDEMWRNPVVEFHEQLPGPKTDPVAGLTWGEMLPPLDIKARVTVKGGQGQDANRLRRIVEMALLEFGDPEIEEFPVEIKSFGGLEPLADCRADALVVNSKLVRPQTESEAMNLVRQVHTFVGRCLLARSGVPSDQMGLFLHGVLSGWLGVHAVIAGGGSADLIAANPLPKSYSAFDLGEQLGAGAAGSPQNLDHARSAAAGGSGPERAVAGEVLERRIAELRVVNSPAEMIELLKRYYKEH
jgi:hypothetical protein